MNDFLDDKEITEALDLVETISNLKIADDMIRLANRERDFIEQLKPTGEDREIAVYNYVILMAASSRLKIMAKALEEKE